MEVTDNGFKALSYYIICLFTVLYETLVFYSIGTCKGFTRVDSSFACKYSTQAEVSDNDKQSSLSQYWIFNDHKKFSITGP
jgi:hypothetical protein